MKDSLKPAMPIYSIDWEEGEEEYGEEEQQECDEDASASKAVTISHGGATNGSPDVEICRSRAS